MGDISELPVLIESQPELEGFNVTIPYKKSIIPYLDQLDAVAAEVGAVNTVKIIRTTDQYTLIGFNTDVIGFEFSIKDFRDIKGVLILGTGGGAEAVQYVLKKYGIPFLFVSRNTRSQQIIGYEDLTNELIGKYPMIVNTTPVGMFPEVDLIPPVPYNFLSSGNFLYDLIYNPAETRFLKLGRQSEAKILNGLTMFLIQANKSWEIWNS
jgi:shikimate dehydrogenase